MEIIPKTGRTHQIRAHLNSCNTSILGDKKYDFQIVERDYAFILDKDVKAGDLVSVIKKTNEIFKNLKSAGFEKVFINVTEKNASN